MGERVNLSVESRCAGLKHARDEAKRRLDEFTSGLPGVIEPAPVPDAPGGSLEVESARREEMARLQRAVLDAQRAYEDQCGESQT